MQIFLWLGVFFGLIKKKIIHLCYTCFFPLWSCLSVQPQTQILDSIQKWEEFKREKKELKLHT